MAEPAQNEAPKKPRDVDQSIQDQKTVDTVSDMLRGKAEEPFQKDLAASYAKAAELLEKAGADLSYFKTPVEKLEIKSAADDARQAATGQYHTYRDYQVPPAAEANAQDKGDDLSKFLSDPNKNMPDIPQDVKDKLAALGAKIQADKKDIGDVDRDVRIVADDQAARAAQGEKLLSQAMASVKDFVDQMPTTDAYKARVAQDVDPAVLQPPGTGGAKPAPAQAPSK